MPIPQCYKLCLFISATKVALIYTIVSEIILHRACQLSFHSHGGELIAVVVDVSSSMWHFATPEMQFLVTFAERGWEDETVEVSGVYDTFSRGAEENDYLGQRTRKGRITGKFSIPYNKCCQGQWQDGFRQENAVYYQN